MASTHMPTLSNLQLQQLLALRLHNKIPELKIYMEITGLGQYNDFAEQ